MSGGRTGKDHGAEHTKRCLREEIESSDAALTREAYRSDIEGFTTSGEGHKQGEDDKREFDGCALGQGPRWQF